MPVSKRTQQEYADYRPSIVTIDGQEYRQFGRAKKNRIVNLYPVPSSNPKRPTVAYVVTESVATGGGGSASLEGWDCGCEAYWFQFENVGMEANCKHIQIVLEQIRTTRHLAREAAIARQLAAHPSGFEGAEKGAVAQEVDHGHAQQGLVARGHRAVGSDLFTAEEGAAA